MEGNEFKIGDFQVLLQTKGAENRRVFKIYSLTLHSFAPALRNSAYEFSGLFIGCEFPISI